MNADVADAVRALERAGTLPPEKARLFSRVARRELVSVHAELRLLAYAGVLLVATGVGLLVQQNIEGHDVSPTVVDFNGDGIPDFLGGAEDGHFYYLRNPRTK